MPSFLARCLGSTRVFLQSSTFPRCSGHCWVACPARRYSRLWVSMAPRLRPVLLPPAAWSCTSPTQDHPVQIVRNGGGQLEQGGIAFHWDTDVIDVGYLQVSPVHHQYSLCIHSCSVNKTFICTCMQGDWVSRPARPQSVWPRGQCCSFPVQSPKY